MISVVTSFDLNPYTAQQLALCGSIVGGCEILFRSGLCEESLVQKFASSSASSLFGSFIVVQLQPFNSSWNNWLEVLKWQKNPSSFKDSILMLRFSLSEGFEPSTFLSRGRETSNQPLSCQADRNQSWPKIISARGNSCHRSHFVSKTVVSALMRVRVCVCASVRVCVC